MSSCSSAGALIEDTVNSNLHLTQIKSNGGLLRRRETGVLGENLSVQRRKPTNSTHISHQIWESNPCHIGGRQVLSPLRHPAPLHLVDTIITVFTSNSKGRPEKFRSRQNFNLDLWYRFFSYCLNNVENCIDHVDFERFVCLFDLL